MLEGQVPRPGPDFPGVKLQRRAGQQWHEAPARSASAGALEVRGAARIRGPPAPEGDVA
jgi:hypothetical protein